ncbi:hypothetical protein SS50377_26223 [Spironucleus salmonicida]|uniref:DNA-directed DNA polymerase n=1 Tax=Spironucleus salmonicida TaxID=348837 RepID=A0A9P8LQ38_9EUKA|nr:hypothetical protein SS50377_26223 [Spironucleus salmonicida]
MVLTADNKKYGLELDGTFYHGLKELSCKDEYHILQHERLEAHNNKTQDLNDKVKLNGFVQIFHVTHKQCIQFEKDNNVKIEVPKRFDITNRSILTEGRAQCFTDHMKINKKKFKMYGIDFIQLYPSAMVFRNWPLSDLVIGTHYGNTIYDSTIHDEYNINQFKFKIDQKYIDQVKQYVKQIPRIINSEAMLQYFLQGCDNHKRLIQIKCQMLPPQLLKYPVLGTNICAKLLYPLCRTCSEQKCLDVNNHARYNHNEDEIILTGVWHGTELINALYEGHKFGEKYEAHTYQTSSFNDNQYQGGNFINSQMFNKTMNSDQDDYKDEAVLKQLANDCNFDYIYNDGIASIKQKSGVEYRQLKLNQGVKTFYTLLLNSTYGKTGQNVVIPTESFDKGEFLFGMHDEELHKNYKLNQLDKYDQEYLCIRIRVVINIKNLIKCILGRNDNNSSKNYALYINKICK